MSENTMLLIAAGVSIAVMAIVFYVLSLRKKRRQGALAALADSLDLDYSEDAEGALADVSDLRLFQRGRARRADNLLRGDHEGVTVEIFDFHYDTKIGDNAATHSQTVLKIRSAALSLPVFEMRPEGFLDKIGGALGYQDIDFEAHPEFSKRYLLRGPDARAVRDAFGPPLLSHLEGTWGLNVEGSGNTLVLYHPERAVRAEEIPAVLAEGMALYRAFLPRRA